MVISMLAIGAVAFALFLLVEWKFASIPMIPRWSINMEPLITTSLITFQSQCVPYTGDRYAVISDLFPRFCVPVSGILCSAVPSKCSPILRHYFGGNLCSYGRYPSNHVYDLGTVDHKV